MRNTENHPTPLFWKCGAYRLSIGKRPLIMGILNVTPDSFSDGGRFFDVGRAVSRALQMEQEGADILDIGGESTRPGAIPVPVEEEVRRVIPVITALAKKVHIPISLDTTKSEVAQQGLHSGVSIINDISGLTRDPRMASVLANSRAGLVIMHSRGTPQTMQRSPRYKNLLGDVHAFFKRQIKRAVECGIAKTSIAIDPGIGFGKTARHNLMLINGLSNFTALGVPLLLGPSRKSFISKVLSRPYRSAQGEGRPFPNLSVTSPETDLDRFEGTAAAVAVAIAKGAHILRVHDVAAMVKVSRITGAILSSA